MSNIKVFVRCRPLQGNEKISAIEVVPQTDEIKVNDRNISFHFDRVFEPEAQQEVVYETIVKPIIDQVLQGFNCTVFAYGPTGTGKTYTMEGKNDCESNLGFIPRTISQLLDTIQDQKEKTTVLVSFLELYNEDTYDLLSSENDTTKLRIFDDVQRKGSVIVGGLSESEISSKRDIYAILERGSLKRQTASTLLNACSSRSHTIFTITVQIKEDTMGEQIIRTGKLNLVDLAGSENVRRSGAIDKRAREAGSINQSLLTLGRVITALVEKRPHIPYRESKLTRLLQDSLGGRTKTSIVATISPSRDDLEDTLSTLDYASNARNIVNKPETNQQIIPRKRDFLKEIEEMNQKHYEELQAVEMSVRNEVAKEFRQKVDKMKLSYEEDLAKMKRDFDESYKRINKENSDREEEIDQLKFKYEALEKVVSTKDKELDDLRLLCQQKNKEVDELTVVCQQKVKEIEDIRLELKCKELECQQLREAKDWNRTNKAANKIRTRSPNQETTEYANMTFDGGDDELMPTDNKARKKVAAGTRKRVLNENITLSGKKRKLHNNVDESELSPISPKQRVTRSRVAKRKLEF